VPVSKARIKKTFRQGSVFEALPATAILHFLRARVESGEATFYYAGPLASVRAGRFRRDRLTATLGRFAGHDRD
jgi:hypothetical protein